MSEADRKRELVAEIKTLGGWARRVEDRFAVGVLDLYLKLPGHPFMAAEGKIIIGHKFGPTLRQFEEGKRMIAAGITAVLIGWKGNVMSISPWVEQADDRHCFNGPPKVKTLMEYLNESR